MAVTRTIVDEVTCDECKTPITDTYYVDAMVYGAAFHERCWTRLLGKKLARLLGLDDIRLRETKADAQGNHAEVPGGRYGGSL